MQDNVCFGLDLLPGDSLEHYGIPRRSGRYPWGSGEDPYHHGADGPGGRKASSGPRESFIKKAANKRAEAKRAKQEAADREAREERQRLKEEAIKSGDPRKLAPFVRELSDAELKQATDRLRLENDFSNKLSEAAKYNKTAADRVQAKLDKLTSYTTTGINAWNNYAKIRNAFKGYKDPNEKMLPIIGEKPKKDKDKGKDKDNGESKEKKINPARIENYSVQDTREFYKDLGIKDGRLNSNYVEGNARYHVTYNREGSSKTEDSYAFDSYQRKIAKRKSVPKLKK